MKEVGWSQNYVRNIQKYSHLPSDRNSNHPQPDNPTHIHTHLHIHTMYFWCVKQSTYDLSQLRQRIKPIKYLQLDVHVGHNVPLCYYYYYYYHLYKTVISITSHHIMTHEHIGREERIILTWY